MSETQVRGPRPGFSDAQRVKNATAHPEDSAGRWLMAAMSSCNVAHKQIDAAIGAESGTTLKYLTNATASQFNCSPDPRDPDAPASAVGVMDDARADQIVEALADLRTAGAFTSRGLDVAVVLALLLRVYVTGTAD